MRVSILSNVMCLKARSSVINFSVGLILVNSRQFSTDMGDKADNKKNLADRFNLANRGPPLTAEDKIANKKRKLESEAKKLATTPGFEFASVVPSSLFSLPTLDIAQLHCDDFSELPKHNRKSSEVIVCGIKQRADEVEDQTIYKYVMRNYVDKGNKPNFAEVSDKFGISKNAPKRKFDRYACSLQREFMEPDPLPCVKDSTLSLESKQKLVKEISKFAGPVQEQRSKPGWKVFIDKLRLEDLQKTEPNSDADCIKPLDERTYEAIFDVVLPDERSTTKMLGGGRIDAQQVPHNAISCCALVEATFKGTAKETIFSSDMFTVWIDPTSNKAQYVRCPKGTLDALRAMKLTPGYEEKGSTLHLGKCSLPAFVTFDPNGDVLCEIMFFIDRNVPLPEDGKYCLYPMESDGGHKNPVRNSTLFAAVLPYQFDEDKLYHQLWMYILIPKTEARCYDLMRLELRGNLQKLRSPTPTPDRETLERSSSDLANCSSRSLPEVLVPPRARLDASREDDDINRKMREDPTWCSHLRSPVHCMDGDNPNVNAIMSSEKMAAYGLRSLKDICASKTYIQFRFLKWAAGCSFVQSPNDVCSAHRTVKGETGAGSILQTVAISMDELSRPVAKFIRDVMTHGVGAGNFLPPQPGVTEFFFPPHFSRIFGMSAQPLTDCLP